MLWLLLAMALAGRGAEPLTDTSPVLSGCEIDYPPYCMVTEDGAAGGYSVELLRAALKAMGRDVTFQTGEWPTIMQDLVDGRLHCLPLVGRTPEREALFDFTFPYITMHGTIVVRDDNADIHGRADLAGKRVAVLEDDNAHEYLRRTNLGAVIVPLPSFATALHELSAGKHDAVVIQKLVAYQLMQQGGLGNLRTVGPPLPGYTQSFCFAVRKGNSELLATLNEGLAIVVADGTQRRLHATWFAALEASVRSKSRLIVGGDADYPPYSYLDDNGQPVGHDVDLMRALAEQIGIAVDIRLDTWSATRQALARGDIDAVLGMCYSAERDLEFDFTPPFAAIQYTIMVRRGAPMPASLGELADQSILLQRGDIIEDTVIQLGYKDRLIPVDSTEEALRRLASGDGDCAIVPRVPALYLIKQHDWRDLAVSAQPVLNGELCIAVPKGHELVLSQLSEGLTVLKSTGEYRQIQAKWLGPYEAASGSTLRSAIGYVLWVTLPLLVLLAGSMLWTRMLRRQVAARTSELEEEVAEHQRTSDRLRSLFDNMQEGFALHQIILGRDGKPADYAFLEINGAFKAYTGLTDAIIGRRVTDVYPGIEAMPFDWIGTYGQVALTGEPVDFEQYFEPNARWYHLFAFSPRRGQFGVLFIDITVRKQVAAERLGMETQLRQAQKLESIGTLASGVAHEINNPINGIMNYADLIREVLPAGSREAEYCSEIIHETQRVATIVRNLLAFSRDEKQTHSPARMGDIVNATLSLIQTVIKRDQIELLVDIPEGLPEIKCRSQQIQQVLMNLLTNARDALNERYPGYDPDKRIALTVRQVEHDGRRWLRTAVEDHGSGVPPALRERIFDPFFTTKDRTQGTGLGLAISYGIVEEHHGSLTVDSEPNRYTRFHLDLPLDNGWDLEDSR